LSIFRKSVEIIQVPLKSDNGNGRLNNLNDPVLNVLRSWQLHSPSRTSKTYAGTKDSLSRQVFRWYDKCYFFMPSNSWLVILQSFILLASLNK